MQHSLSHLSVPQTLPLLFRHRKKQRIAVPHVYSDDQPVYRRQKRLICKTCSCHITSAEHRTVIDQSHRHTFFNPSGAVFEIGCFRQAYSCNPVGRPSSEFSWFASMVWTPVVCSECLSHLGWVFEGNSRRFYGLILKQLVEVEGQE